jgi:LysM repeat protein
MRLVSILLCLLLMSGCLVRTYTVEKPRVDTDRSGNQGYLSGEPTGEEEQGKKKLSDTRKVSVWELELGWGKPKVVHEGVKTEDEMYMRDEYGTEELVMVESVTDEGVAGRYQNYKVQKNDTLQKISYKFYGTTRKWMKIFEANKDKLKTPDKIFPGMTIRIPVE